MARIAWGTTLTYDGGEGGAYIDLGGAGELKSFTSPKTEFSNVDVTGITQATNVMQAIPGMAKGGSFNFEMFYAADTYTTVCGLASAPHNFRLSIDGTTQTWTGYIDSVGELTGGGANDPLVYKFSVFCNTAVTIDD